MWNSIETCEAPGYWPPKPSRFWCAVLDPFRKRYLRSHYGVAEVAADQIEELYARFAPGDGVLLAPNHSYDGDPHVMMEVGCRANRRFYFLAAWQLFRGHRGIDGWILQRMGAFSVDREGVDRRAIRHAVEVLAGGDTLVVFPEGEIYRLNGRLTPILEGVAFMACTAQRELEESNSAARVWIVPTAIRYTFLEDIRPRLESTMDRLEARLTLKPQPGASLAQRILRFGEVLLTIKEKEVLGRSCENDGELPARLRGLTSSLLQRLESEHLGRTLDEETTPMRLKAVRRRMLETWTDENAPAEARQNARRALDEAHLVLQLYSYPGDYLTEDPSLERMAETIDKFEEDIEGVIRAKGRRRAEVRFGEPLDMKQKLGAARPRAVVTEATEELEQAIQSLLDARPMEMEEASRREVTSPR
jgi:1-acyl-sn-glycerol-3-phosphate acyltransferase